MVQHSNYVFHLPGIEMELTVAGFTAEAKYKLFKTDLFETDLKSWFWILLLEL